MQVSDGKFEEQAARNGTYVVRAFFFSSPCLFMLTCLKRELLVSCLRLIPCFGCLLIEFLMEM